MALATLEQLAAIPVFSSLESSTLEKLQPKTRLHPYQAGEVVMHEGDRLPACLYVVLTGLVRITKTGTNGKETILRTLTTGEIFAAPALLGDRIAPATVTVEQDCQVLTLEREAFLDAIRHEPEIALKLLSLFNQRLQQLHNTVHGLVSERAIVRLARLLQYAAAEQGTEATTHGKQLRAHLPYYQIARSIGITYEECVRLFKQIHPAVVYSRGGKITIQDAAGLEAIASGMGTD